MTNFPIAILLFLTCFSRLRSVFGLKDEETCSTQRKMIIGGNWKLNPTTRSGAEKLAQELKDLLDGLDNIEVVIFPPFPLLQTLQSILNTSTIKLGAQDMFYERSGAFTGAVSGILLKEFGVSHVLIGHSERRNVFHENDATINRKLKQALSEGLTPILCIGESKAEYDAGLNQQVCANQLSKALQGIPKEDIEKIVIAYEPIWAIGTGLVCPAEIAQQMHKFIRSTLAQMYSLDAANSVRIQYGGSVHALNALDIMVHEDIDGTLVGGASLSAENFAKIVQAALMQACPTTVVEDAMT